MFFRQFHLPGLGHASYLVGSEQTGEALVLDPQRRVDGYYRCLLCRAQAVARRRRAVKRILIEEAGGACRLCGYDRAPAALQFHHLDPAQKSFQLSRRGATIALDAARAEVAKCVLLCANCHAEVEAGVATVR